MTEYTDLKNRTYRVLEKVRDDGMERKTAEQRETAEREMIEMLFRIFQAKSEAANEA